MKLNDFMNKLKDAPDSVEFSDTMAIIDALYDFTPTTFQNGEVLNATGQNNGSCKLFAFAKLNDLTEQQTLNCFGAYYRNDVLKHPDGSDHQNIRNFIKYGWAGIQYDALPLTAKA